MNTLTRKLLLPVLILLFPCLLSLPSSGGAGKATAPDLELCLLPAETVLVSAGADPAPEAGEPEDGGFALLGEGAAAAEILRTERTETGFYAEAFCPDSGASLFCAVYDGDGRLVSMEIRPAAAGTGSYSFSCGAAAEARFFLLDSAFRPLCAGKTLRLRTEMEDTEPAGDAGAVRLDAAFAITPSHTENADPGLDWDMLIWADAQVEFEFFRRPGVETGAENPNTWEKLPGTGKILPAPEGDGDYVGQSLNLHLDTKSAAAPHPLRDVTERWEYAIHILKLNGSEDRSAWDGTVTFRTHIVSGSSRSLQALAINLTKRSLADALAGNTPWSPSTAVKEIGSPAEFDIPISFGEAVPPAFAEGYPRFRASKDKAEMELMLDRAGTVFYMAAPFTVEPGAEGQAAGLRLSAAIPALDRSGRALTGCVNEEGVFEAERVPKEGSSSFRLSRPSPAAVLSTGGSDTGVLSGSLLLEDGAATAILRDLTPETNYFVYFVLQGKNHASSEYVLLYQFRTPGADRPVLSLSLSGPEVTVLSRDRAGDPQPAEAEYRLAAFHAAALPAVLLEPFEAHVRPEGPDPDIGAPSWEAYREQIPDYAPDSFTVLRAMASDYSAGGCSQGSVFDIYASDSVRQTASEYIRGLRTGDGAAAKAGSLSLTPESGCAAGVDCSGALSGRMWYVFLAAGSDTGTGEAFRAIYPVCRVDMEPPKVAFATLTGAFDIASGVFPEGGQLILQFDEPLYYKTMSWSGGSGSIMLRPAAGAGLQAVRTVSDIEPPPISMDSITTKPAYYALAEPEAETELALAARRPCQTLVYSFSKAFDNDLITFNSGLCDFGGSSGAAPLSVQLRIRKNQYGEYEAAAVVPEGWDAGAADTNPSAPKVILTVLSGNFDPLTGTFPDGGQLIIQLDKPLYYLEQDRQALVQLLRPVAGVDSGSLTDTEGRGAPVSISRITHISDHLTLLEPENAGEREDAARRPCQTLIYTFSELANNDIITFDSELCDSGGNSRSLPLSVQVRIGRNRSGEFEALVVVPSAWDARMN